MMQEETKGQPDGERHSSVDEIGK